MSSVRKHVSSRSIVRRGGGGGQLPLSGPVSKEGSAGNKTVSI